MVNEYKFRKRYCTLMAGNNTNIITIFTLGGHDPQGGLKIRKIYKKFRMSSNPCSHDLANCHATEKRKAL